MLGVAYLEKGHDAVFFGVIEPEDGSPALPVVVDPGVHGLAVLLGHVPGLHVGQVVVVTVAVLLLDVSAEQVSQCGTVVVLIKENNRELKCKLEITSKILMPQSK